MKSPEKVKVELGERSYDILIGEELLKSSADYLKGKVTFPCFIVTDSNIPDAYSSALKNAVESFASGKTVEIIKIAAGESSKSFNGLEGLLDKIFPFNPERKTTLIALGGGVVGDLTGFAASILLRGVNFIQIPTTLLSQVDSSVGGKTGINNKFGKNLIGSFYQPSLVLADISTLATLSHREFLAGYAEVVKYGLINDAEFFNWLEENLDLVINKKPDALKYIIARSCKAKADIVASDEKEGGARALLNLGHTFGHAIEQQLEYDGRVVHGEAVAIGMVFAFMLSNKLGLCSKDDVEAVKNHLKKAGLPVSPLDLQKEWDAEELMAAMQKDKKVSDGKMVFILVKGIGKSFIQKDIDSKIIHDTIISVINEN